MKISSMEPGSSRGTPGRHLQVQRLGDNDIIDRRRMTIFGVHKTTSKCGIPSVSQKITNRALPC
jgi:hypothetical protein